MPLLHLQTYNLDQIKLLLLLLFFFFIVLRVEPSGPGTADKHCTTELLSHIPSPWVKAC